MGRKGGRRKVNPPIKLPTAGSGIPLGWNALPDARKLYVAMDGLGTSENMIWNALDGKTKDQLAAIYNEFNNQYQADSGEDLLGWFKGDLSGTDLSRALNYYKDIL